MISKSLSKISFIVFLAVSIVFCFPMKAADCKLILIGDGEISFYNIHTHEKETIVYRDEKGRYKRSGFREIKKMLSCHFTGKEHFFDRDLIQLVDQIQDHFGHRTIEVISGFRSKEYNKHLFEMGRHVSKDSPHMYGQALDIRISGIPTYQIREYAKKLKRGGVGYYPSDGFVHVDVGLMQYW